MALNSTRHGMHVGASLRTRRGGSDEWSIPYCIRSHSRMCPEFKLILLVLVKHSYEKEQRIEVEHSCCRSYANHFGETFYPALQAMPQGTEAEIAAQPKKPSFLAIDDCDEAGCRAFTPHTASTQHSHRDCANASQLHCAVGSHLHRAVGSHLLCAVGSQLRYGSG
jgi:hypothetical protein